MLTQERLKSRLRFDENTGKFFWRDTRGRVNIGDEAGCINRDNGYVYIKFDGRNYQAHQLAWLYVHGELLRGLDHCNRVRHDNRIENLRRATQSQNCANMTIPKSNKSGVKGVCWCKVKRKWRVQIRVNYCRTHLGYFESIEAAGAAYAAAAHKAWGEFSTKS